MLAIDMDPQGNMSSGLGVDKNEVEKTIYELIIGKCKIEECICTTNRKPECRCASVKY